MRITYDLIKEVLKFDTLSIKEKFAHYEILEKTNRPMYLFMKSDTFETIRMVAEVKDGKF